MAKLADGTTLAVTNIFTGDASPSVDKIVVAGSRKVTFYRATCTQAEYEKGIEFEEADAMAYIEEAGDITISDDVTEKEMYMLKNKAKIATTSSIDDVDYTEAITTDGLEHYINAKNDNKGMAIAAFDAGSGLMIYSIWGTMSKLTRSTPQGDDCTVSYTLSASSIDIKCYSPESPKVSA